MVGTATFMTGKRGARCRTLSVTNSLFLGLCVYIYILYVYKEHEAFLRLDITAI